MSRPWFCTELFPIAGEKAAPEMAMVLPTSMSVRLPAMLRYSFVRIQPTSGPPTQDRENVNEPPERPGAASPLPLIFAVVHTTHSVL